MQRHRKKLWLVSAVFLFGLVGCGTDHTGDKTAQNRQNNNPMSVGYYSNENHEQRGGNAVILDGADNDGPVTEIMDHSFGSERNAERQHNRYTGAPNNNAYGNAVIGNNDRNYHGHLSNVKSDSLRKYHDEEDGNIMQKVNETVENIDNVKEAETIVNRANITVGVQLENNQQTNATIQKIRKAIEPHANGRQVQIFTNTSQYNRIKSINNNMNHGNSRGQSNSDQQNFFTPLSGG